MINNLLRDLNHVRPEQSPVTWASFTFITDRRVVMNSSGTVYQDAGVAQAEQTSQGGSTIYSAGLLIAQPIVDAAPYRVKAYVECTEESMLFVGYANTSSGISDTISKCSFFPLTTADSPIGHFDDCILMPGLNPGDADYEKPIGFGIAIRSSANHLASFHMSVQNLAKPSPQYAASMA